MMMLGLPFVLRFMVLPSYIVPSAGLTVISKERKDNRKNMYSDIMERFIEKPILPTKLLTSKNYLIFER